MIEKIKQNIIGIETVLQDSDMDRGLAWHVVGELLEEAGLEDLYTGEFPSNHREYDTLMPEQERAQKELQSLKVSEASEEDEEDDFEKKVDPEPADAVMQKAFDNLKVQPKGGILKVAK